MPTTPTEPTPKAQEFIAANKKSPVVEGRVLNEQGGARYTLKNGTVFILTVEDCRSLPTMPRWKF